MKKTTGQRIADTTFVEHDAGESPVSDYGGKLARRIDAAMSRRDRKWIDAIRRFSGEDVASNIIDRVMNDRKVVKCGQSDVTIYKARDAKARKR